MADVLRCERADATWPFRRLLRSLRFCLSALRSYSALERILHRVAHGFRPTDRRRRNLRVLQGEDASDILDGHPTIRVLQPNSEERKFTAHRSGLHGLPPPPPCHPGMSSWVCVRREELPAATVETASGNKKRAAKPRQVVHWHVLQETQELVRQLEGVYLLRTNVAGTDAGQMWEDYVTL